MSKDLEVLRDAFRSMNGGPSFRCRLLVGYDAVSKSVHKSVDFSVQGDLNDDKTLAQVFRELANVLEAPTVEDKELI